MDAAKMSRFEIEQGNKTIFPPAMLDRPAKTSRLPRFTRSRFVHSFTITSRDLEIIMLVARHRFLRSTHVVALLNASPQGVLRRLQLLFHHGYLERPRAQLEYFHQAGSKEIAYGIGSKGAKLLREKFGDSFAEGRWS